MPLVFDEIETSIAPERGTDTGTRGSGGGEAQELPSNPAELADAIRRELKIVEERRARLLAD